MDYTKQSISVYYKFGFKKNTPYIIRLPFIIHGRETEFNITIDFDSMFFRKSKDASDFVSLLFRDGQSPDLTDNGLVRYMDKQSCFMKNYNNLIRLKNNIIDVFDNNTDDSWSLELSDPMHSAFQVLPKINLLYINGDFDYISSAPPISTVPFIRIKEKETLAENIYKEIVPSNSHKFEFVKNIDVKWISDDIKPISISNTGDLCYVPGGYCIDKNGIPMTTHPMRHTKIAIYERIAD